MPPVDIYGHPLLKLKNPDVSGLLSLHQWIDCLVHSNLQSSMNTRDDSNGTLPCCRPRCKACAYTSSAAQINTPGGPLTIRQKFACATSNLIYIITCCIHTPCVTPAKLDVGSATDSASISDRWKESGTTLLPRTHDKWYDGVRGEYWIQGYCAATQRGGSTDLQIPNSPTTRHEHWLQFYLDFFSARCNVATWRHLNYLNNWRASSVTAIHWWRDRSPKPRDFLVLKRAICNFNWTHSSFIYWRYTVYFYYIKFMCSVLQNKIRFVYDFVIWEMMFSSISDAWHGRLGHWLKKTSFLIHSPGLKFTIIFISLRFCFISDVRFCLNHIIFFKSALPLVEFYRHICSWNANRITSL